MRVRVCGPRPLRSHKHCLPLLIFRIPNDLEFHMPTYAETFNKTGAWVVLNCHVVRMDVRVDSGEVSQEPLSGHGGEECPKVFHLGVLPADQVLAGYPLGTRAFPSGSTNPMTLEAHPQGRGNLLE